MKRVFKIAGIVIGGIGLLYLGLVVYVRLNGSGSPMFMDYRYNALITEPLAHMGCADAQYKMGAFWLYGSGIEPTQEEYEQATFWFKRAIEQGNTEALLDLGFRYNDGDDVDQDDEKAAYWWRKAAEQGDVQAQYTLGLCYRRGVVVAKDDEKAAYWWRKAAEQGDVKAQRNLGVYYAQSSVIDSLEKAFALQKTHQITELQTTSDSIEYLLDSLQIQSMIQKGRMHNNIPQSHFTSNVDLAFDTLMVKKGGLIFRNGVTLDLAYSFVYPINNTPEINKVRNLMIQDFFFNDTILTLSEAAVRYEKDILKEYASQTSNTTHQYSQQYSAVRIINDKILVLMMQGYCYWGGTHGLEPVSYGNYDLRRGERISLDMLFPKDKEPELLELIKAKLENFNSTEKVFISDKFMLLPKGIQFCYNQYWIGSYSEGIIKVTLPYSKIKRLLNQSAHYYFHEK